MATGFHGFHVLVGTIFLIVCLVRAYKGHFTPRQHFGFEAAAWYWHFVDVVWLFLFVGLRLGRLGRAGTTADPDAARQAADGEPRPAAVPGLCPRCGARTLFAGDVPASRRAAAPADSISPPSMSVTGRRRFLILIIGGIVTGLALWLELDRQPPFWLHVLLWPPLTCVAVIGLLRIGQGRAARARISERGAGEGRQAIGQAMKLPVAPTVVVAAGGRGR